MVEGSLVFLESPPIQNLDNVKNNQVIKILDLTKQQIERTVFQTPQRFLAGSLSPIIL